MFSLTTRRLGREGRGNLIALCKYLRGVNTREEEELLALKDNAGPGRNGDTFRLELEEGF